MNDQYPNSGIIFRDDSKKDERDRDYRGECIVHVKQYWIWAWIKQGTKGRFVALSFKPKEPRKPQPSASSAASNRSATPASSSTPGRTPNVVPDDIPFRSTIY